MRWWVVLLVGCAGEPPRPAPPANPPNDSPAAPADSLVLTTPDGFQVWFAEGRAAADSAGGSCYERSVEIRRDTQVVKVPLLFTDRPPTGLGPGFIKAELMRGCRVIADYRVELATGRPTKIADR